MTNFHEASSAPEARDKFRDSGPADAKAGPLRIQTRRRIGAECISGTVPRFHTP